MFLFQLVMSSDKISSLQTPLVNLDLQIKNGTSEKKMVSLELDQKDLKKLISSLDNAGKVIIVILLLLLFLLLL